MAIVLDCFVYFLSLAGDVALGNIPTGGIGFY